MIKKILDRLANDLLVEITQHELRVFSLTGDAKYIDEPLIAVERVDGKEIVLAIGSASKNCVGPGISTSNPFSHSRSMISSFEHAEKILQHAFRSTLAGAFQASPRVVMHQLEKNQGGLTDVEQRLLEELALAAGAREVVVYQGGRINPSQDSFDNIKARVHVG